jgi:hypothetical protein
MLYVYDKIQYKIYSVFYFYRSTRHRGAARIVGNHVTMTSSTLWFSVPL